MIKLICSDVDNTILFDKRGKIAPETFDAFAAALNHGALVAAVSGRPIVDLIGFFGAFSEKMILASYEGALVTYNGNVLWDRPISPDLYRAFADFYTGKTNVEYVIYTADKAVVPSENGLAAKLLKESVSMTGHITAGKPSDVKDPVYKLSLVSESGKTDFDFDREQWNSYMYNIYSGGHWCEFTAKDLNKEYSLNMIMEKLGLNRSEVMAFGDGRNDIGMLGACDFSFAMQNASDEVKEAAAYTTDSVSRTVKSFFR